MILLLLTLLPGLAIALVGLAVAAAVHIADSRRTKTLSRPAE